jgi:hypothetical protein
MHFWSTFTRLTSETGPQRYWNGWRCKKAFLSGSVTFFLPFSGTQRVSCVLEYVVHLSGRTAQTMHSPCCNINYEAIERSEWMRYQHCVPVCDVMSPVSLQWWNIRGHESNSSCPSHLVGHLVCLRFVLLLTTLSPIMCFTYNNQWMDDNK